MVCCVILPVSEEALHYRRSIIDISTIKLTSEFFSIAWIWLLISHSLAAIKLTSHRKLCICLSIDIHHIAHSLTLTLNWSPWIDLSNISTNTQHSEGDLSWIKQQLSQVGTGAVKITNKNIPVRVHKIFWKNCLCQEWRYPILLT